MLCDVLLATWASHDCGIILPMISAAFSASDVASEVNCLQPSAVPRYVVHDLRGNWHDLSMNS